MIKELIVTSRPVSWVNTAYPFAAAYVLTSGTLDLRLVLGSLFFLVPYNLAMYGINDVFDYESDLRNPRKGGVEGAVVSRSRHRMILVACALTAFPFVIWLLTQGGWPANLALLISIFAVISYSAPGLRFKERPFLDSATSATHFVAPAMYGLLLAQAELSGPTLAVIIGYFFWCMASHAYGSIQDILPDRKAQIGSIGTVLGARRTAWGSLMAYGLAGVLMLALPLPGSLVALLALPYMINIIPALKLNDEQSERASPGWRRFLWMNYVTGFLITMLFIWLSLPASTMG